MKVKKLLFSITIITTVFVACQSDDIHVNQSNSIQIENKDIPDAAFEKFKTLYSKLLEIKDTPQFKKNGFGGQGEAREWLNEIQKFKSNPDSKLLIQKDVLVGDLEMLGYEYAKSKGEETEVTRTFNQIFKEAIN